MRMGGFNWIYCSKEASYSSRKRWSATESLARECTVLHFPKKPHTKRIIGVAGMWVLDKPRDRESFSKCLEYDSRPCLVETLARVLAGASGSQRMLFIAGGELDWFKPS